MNSSYSYNQYYSQFHDHNQYHPPLILKQEDDHHHHHLDQAADDVIRSTKNKKKKKTAAAAAAGKGGVRLSTDPQSVAARERRHRISHRLKTLQSLVPGAAKLDTVSVLDHAIHYVHFLRSQIRFHHLLLLSSSDSAMDNLAPPPPPPPPNCFGGEAVGPSPPYHGGVWVEEACCFGSPVQGGSGACSGGSTPYF